jgi:hypothetical protein
MVGVKDTVIILLFLSSVKPIPAFNFRVRNPCQGETNKEL